MKRLTITALLVLAATVANANEYKGKDAVKIISKGKIMGKLWCGTFLNGYRTDPRFKKSFGISWMEN